MIVNVISKQVSRTKLTGPKKVLINTLKGLDALDVKYVLNQPINEYQYNWIHDNQEAIIEAGFVEKPVLVGPNTAVLPKDLPLFRKKLPEGSIYLHPGKWSVEVWQFLGYNEAKLDVWPVGIDIEQFMDIPKENKTKILLYFKKRNLNLLERAKQILENLSLEYVLIHYGFYEEREYQEALQKCKFGIWIGCSESQGIGLEEALATNLPLIVLNATSLFDNEDTNQYHFPLNLKDIETTTVPYFDKRCGIVINTIDDLEKSIDIMNENITQYQPRKFIQEYLSLQSTTKQFINFFNQIPLQEKTNYNYQIVSKVLYYFGLLFRKSAWMWLWKKIVCMNYLAIKK